MDLKGKIAQSFANLLTFENTWSHALAEEIPENMNVTIHDDELTSF